MELLLMMARPLPGYGFRAAPRGLPEGPRAAVSERWVGAAHDRNDDEVLVHLPEPVGSDLGKVAEPGFVLLETQFKGFAFGDVEQHPDELFGLIRPGRHHLPFG